MNSTANSVILRMHELWYVTWINPREKDTPPQIAHLLQRRPWGYVDIILTTLRAIHLRQVFSHPRGSEPQNNVRIMCILRRTWCSFWCLLMKRALVSLCHKWKCLSTHTMCASMHAYACMHACVCVCVLSAHAQAHQLYNFANHIGMFAEAKSCVGRQEEESREVTDTSV
jgi:hypothetical protein